MRRVALLLGLVLLTTIAGCSYGGIATSPDGQTIYIARNNGAFFGLGRRIYACKVSGQLLNCGVMHGEP